MTFHWIRRCLAALTRPNTCGPTNALVGVRPLRLLAASYVNDGESTIAENVSDGPQPLCRIWATTH